MLELKQFREGKLYLVANPDLFDACAELGMGFHFGVTEDAEGADVPEGLIVLNGSVALTPKDIMQSKSAKVLSELFSSSITPDKAILQTLIPTRSIVPSDDIALLTQSFGHCISNMQYFENRSRVHSSPPFPMVPTSPQNFVRFSAFRNDRWVQSNGGLLAGTYVTSDRDANHATSGFRSGWQVCFA
jgi:hypothetical protein